MVLFDKVYYYTLLALILVFTTAFVLIWRYYHRNSSTMKYVGDYIPKIVHQTWKIKDKEDDFHRLLLSRHEKMSPSWTFILYDDKDIDTFLEENFSSQVIRAYKSINPRYGASRADFFRYCVLYVYGGVYLDFKSLIRKDLDQMKMSVDSEDDDLLIVGHWKSTVWKEILEDPKGEIMNWVMMSTPKNPMLKKVIEQMVLNIESFSTANIVFQPKLGDKYAATKSKYIVLETTGPLMFSKVLWKNRDDSSFQIKDNLIHEYFEYLGFSDYVNAYRKIGAQHYSFLNDDRLVMK